MFSHNEFNLQSVFSILCIALSNVAILFGLKQRAPQVAIDPTNDTCANLTGNVVIVTGSNTGIGKSTATKLAKRGATIILACRKVKDGMKALMDISEQLEKCPVEQYPYARNGKVFFMRMDLSSLQSVADFVERFKEQFQRLDILVNNAGLNTSGTTQNGLEQLFQVNYLGHYLLTTSLLDLMTNDGPATPSDSGIAPPVARVVNLSSTMHHLGQANFKVSAFGSYSMAMKLKGHSYYCDSKLYMNLLAMEINRRCDFHKPYGDGLSKATATSSSSSSSQSSSKRPIVGLCANPGAVQSDIWRNSVLNSLRFVMDWLFLTVDQGSATSVYAATVNLDVLRDYQRRHSARHGQAKLGDNFVFCSDVPCIIPYAVSPDSPKLHTEIMAAYAGPRFGAVTFPDATEGIDAETPAQLAEQLWEYSATLCEQQMKVSLKD